MSVSESLMQPPCYWLILHFYSAALNFSICIINPLQKFPCSFIHFWVLFNLSSIVLGIEYIIGRSKHLLISCLQSPSAVLLEPKKYLIASTVFPSICHEQIGPDAMILAFWMLSFKPTFSLSSFTFIKRLFSSSLLSAIRVVSSAYLRLFQFVLHPVQHFSSCTLNVS